MKILITTLNWGLGHASRCMPIINEFLNHGCEVILASDGRAGELLKSEYPNLKYYKLPSYRVHYTGSNFTRTMLKQAFKIYRAINDENRATELIVHKENVDAILSDNRYGCYNRSAKSIFLSHQLNITTSSVWISKIANHINQKYIACFDEVWVPDWEEEPGMAGELSHNSIFDSKYVGLLSRMKYGQSVKLYDICIVLSGPEPKRTDLEQELMDQALQMKDKKIIIIQGKTEDPVSIEKINPNLKIVSSMTSENLNRVLLQSDLVVSRSGYSTIMDLYRLNKRAVLVPTKGQTEQEYLSERLKKSNICEIQNEEEINLKRAFQQRKKFSGFKNINENNDLTALVKQLMNSLNHKNPHFFSNSVD